MPESTRPLTPLMQAAILTAKACREDDSLVVSTLTSAPTFRGLRSRELINLDGSLTETGLRLHANLTETQRRAERAKALRAPRDPKPLGEFAGAHTFRPSPNGKCAFGDCGATQASSVHTDRDQALEVPASPSPAQQAAAEGDRYMSTGPGADVKARDVQVIPGKLPQRVPAVALTEELTGERVPDAPAATQGVRYRPSVSLRPVTGEVVERATPETFVAVGAIWGRLEGHRVRIVAMDGDVFHMRPLMIAEAGPGEPNWTIVGQHTVHMPVALHEGTTVLVDGYQLYQVKDSPYANEGPGLLPVRS